MILTTRPMVGCASTINYSMNRSSSNRIERLLSSIPGRVGLVILTSMVIASALLLLFWANLNISSLLLAVIVLTGIGFISGLASRWFLRRNTAALRLLAALTALSFSLALVGVITDGTLGLSLAPKSLDNPDWRGLLQISWSGTVTWLALRAWHTPIRIKEPKVKTSKPSPKRSSKPKVRVPNKERPWQRISKKISRPSLKAKSGSKTAINTKRRPVKITPTKVTSKRIAATKKSGLRSLKKLRFNRAKESVKLVGNEEHHCPYCLENVEKRDPRGVKICTICKTWHHADCWSVTDACQVPHEH